MRAEVAKQTTTDASHTYLHKDTYLYTLYIYSSMRFKLQIGVARDMVQVLPGLSLEAQLSSR